MEIYYESELYHHGIKGQKWGVRRYQEADGTYTRAGRKRYSDGKPSKEEKKRKRQLANDVEQRQKELREQAYKKATKGTKLEKYTAESDAIRERYELNEDGSGGKDATPYFVRSRYAELQYKKDRERKILFDSDSQAKIERGVQRKLESEFGKEGIKAMEDEHTRQAKVGAVAAVGMMAGIVGATVLMKKAMR